MTPFFFEAVSHIHLPAGSIFMRGEDSSFQGELTELEMRWELEGTDICWSLLIDKFDKYLSGWWFQLFFFFTPNLGGMIQFDAHIFEVHPPPPNIICFFCWGGGGRCLFVSPTEMMCFFVKRMTFFKRFESHSPCQSCFSLTKSCWGYSAGVALRRCRTSWVARKMASPFSGC